MATHCSALAWGMPWTQEPAGYGPRGQRESDRNEPLGLRVGRDAAGFSSLSFGSPACAGPTPAAGAPTLFLTLSFPEAVTPRLGDTPQGAVWSSTATKAKTERLPSPSCRPPAPTRWAQGRERPGWNPRRVGSTPSSLGAQVWRVIYSGRPDVLFVSLSGDGVPVVDKFRFPSELFHDYILVAFPSSMKT